MHSHSDLIRCTAATLLLLTGLMLYLPAPALAQAASAEAAARQALEQAGSDGKVLSVREKRDEHGERYFEVQLLSKGNIRILKVPRS